MMDINILIKQTQTLSLLYVEDDKQARLETAEILSMFFKDITLATNGKEGIHKVELQKFDLIITDIKMPHLDGIKMLEKIREFDQNIPIIIISAYKKTTHFTNCIQYGVSAYLLKPFKLEELTTVLHQVIENIILKHKLTEYKNLLERRVKEQVEELHLKDILMSQQARFAAMGEMLNTILHQWRQPLNRINSNVSVISMILESNTIDHKILETKIKNIERNIEYMSNTIEDFSNFFHPNKEMIDFRPLDIIQWALKLIISRTRDIDIKVISDKYLWVSSYENEYLQIILTILNNSIDNFNVKATKNRKINIILKSHKEMIGLFICDNGGGIALKDIDNIFEPYFTTKFSKEGTGLGLYIAKMITESSMGGTLKAFNTRKGVCFEIMIAKKEFK